MSSGASGVEIKGSHSLGSNRDIAIIGMAGLFPHAPTLIDFWQNILGRVDAVTDPPPGAWRPELHYDPSSADNDRIYCKRGGFLAPVAYFNPLEFGVMPLAVDGGEPDQWLALRVARDALADAGYLHRLDAREKTSVVIGKGTYVNRGNFSGAQHSLIIDQTLNILKSLHPEFGPAELAEIRREFKANLPPFSAETASGLIPNIIAGRIANRLDLMGPSYTVDAACASSLIAAHMGIRDLLTGECDLALVGGSQVTTPIPILSLFCQLNALSRRQEIRPFDREADGTILGEGIGMIVLKRRADAERDGDRIYAVIKGIGTASDGHGTSVMAPRVAGEELALRRAYETATVDPGTVELVEAHGTATLVGDAAELTALSNIFGSRSGSVPRIALGTVKSMIGHTMAASGIAGMIKTALALHHRVLPPTLHVTDPTPSLDRRTSNFYVNSEIRPWIHGDPKSPRRAGVNAFGFGGINAHAVLEEFPESNESSVPSLQLDFDTELFVFSAPTSPLLVERLAEMSNYLDRNPNTSLKDLAFTVNTGGVRDAARLAVVAADLTDLQSKLGRARQRLTDGKSRQIKDVSGNYFFSEPLAKGGKIAVLFPGEGSQYSSMLADLCIHFPRVRQAFDQIDRIFHQHPRGFRPSDVFFPPTHLLAEDRAKLDDRLWQSDGAYEAVLTANHAMWTILSDLGLRPDAVVGHSTGEYSAMRAAGVLDHADESEYARFVLALNEGYQNALATDTVPPAGMLAVGSSRERVADVAKEAGGQLYVAMDNCLHQAVIVGVAEDVERAREIAKREGLIYEYLTFDRAYHTPLFAPYLEHLRLAFDHAKVQPAVLPIYSCTTAAPYPSDPEEIRHLMVDHWIEPVEFRQTIERLYADGFRVFVEAGARGNLTTFVEDILRGRPHSAVASNVQRRSGISQLHHTLAILSAQGVDLNLDVLYQRRRPRKLDLAGQPTSVTEVLTPSSKLTTALPILTLSDGLIQKLRSVKAPKSEAGIVEPLISTTGETATARPSVQENATHVSGHSIDLDPVFDGAEPGADILHQAAAVVDSTPELVPSESKLSPDSLTPDVPEPVIAMEDYFQTMEQFLTVQADVLQAFFQQEPDVVPTRSLVSSALSIAHQAGAGRLDKLGTDLRPSANSYQPTHQEARPMPVSIKDAFGELDGRGDDRGKPPIAAPPAGDLNRGRQSRGLPLIGRILSFIPGDELVAERTVDPLEDAYLRDHTLGRSVSDVDPDLLALPVMPMMMSLELLAESAAAILPNLKVVALQEIRAHRWIAFQDEPQVLMVIARRRAGHPNLVDAYIRNLTEDQQADDLPKSPVIEATIVLAEDYPVRPPRLHAQLTNPRESIWQPDRLYRDAMFHGPGWQGVSSIVKTGDNGTVATLPVLPWTNFFRGESEPTFVLDPVVLDAAGQVPGFWFLEHVPPGEMIFPYRVAAIEFYGPQRPVGELLTCTTNSEFLGERQVKSDIDVVDGDGGLWIRLVGLEDLRFPIPRSLQLLVLDTRTTDLSQPWATPTSHLASNLAVTARRIEPTLSTHPQFWKRVWADCILSRAERPTFHRLRTPDSRQVLWLAGRSAAKEAVRDLLRSRYQLDIPLADIEITTDERGRPIVGGAWKTNVDAQATVSIAHTTKVAVAVAALAGPPLPSDHPRGTLPLANRADSTGPRWSADLPLIGIDIEERRNKIGDLAEMVLSEAEQMLVRDIPERDRADWVLRGWCAKEAIGKALGYGLVDGPRSVHVVGADLRSGTIFVELAGQLAHVYPEFAATRLIAHSWVEGDIVVATTLCESETPRKW